MKKRILAALLAAFMAVSIMPAISVTTLAAGDEEEYVSLPITIRDYAADGMLFEWNDMGQTGDFTKEISAGNTTWTNNTYSYDNENNGWGANQNWICIYTSGKNIATFAWVLIRQ